MKEEVVHGILLHITSLPTGDALLQVFTREYGKMTLRAKSFENSKKRRAEVDFFRLLEITIVKGRSNWSIRSVVTTSVFLVFQDSYELNQKGFHWLEKIRWCCPEEKEMGTFFHTFIEILGRAEKQSLFLFDLFFRIQLLHAIGHMNRFDILRGDVYFDPINFEFSLEQQKERMIFIPHTTRQVLEWLRRSSTSEVQQKESHIPKESLNRVGDVLTSIEQYHVETH